MSERYEHRKMVSRHALETARFDLMQAIKRDMACEIADKIASQLCDGRQHTLKWHTKTIDDPRERHIELQARVTID